MLPWSRLLGCLLFYLRKRSLEGFSYNLLSKGKALGRRLQVQGLKSYNAMTVHGSFRVKPMKF